MRILVTVEDKAIQNEILNTLEGEKGMDLRVSKAGSTLADQLDESGCTIIVGTGPKDLELQDSIIALKLEHPLLRVLTIGPQAQYKHLLAWLFTGASAAIINTELTTSLIPVLRQLDCGPSVACFVISSQLLLNLFAQKAALVKRDDYRLTDREKEVLTGITKGLSYKMLGYAMNISRETVRGHVKNIYKKINVSSLTQAVAKAIKEDLV